MSVHGMKPLFNNYEGYQEWRRDLRGLYAHANQDVRESKNKIKALQREIAAEQSILRANDADHMGNQINLNFAKDELAETMKEHRYKRATVRKLMTVLEEANIRWSNIRAMYQGVKNQMKEFPLAIESTRNIDFHFNKKSLEFDFVPTWVVKAQGKTFYVHHVDCQTGFTTRETPDHPSTKGSIRVRRGSLNLDAEGNAVIS